MPGDGHDVESMTNNTVGLMRDITHGGNTPMPQNDSQEDYAERALGFSKSKLKIDCSARHKMTTALQ